MTITDVPSPGGWIQLYGVRIAKALAVGTVSLAAVMNIFGAINFQSVSGTSTGSTIQVNGLTRDKTFPVTFNASGGLTGQYSAFNTRSPFTTTGAIKAINAECGNMAMALTGDFSFKKASIAATGATIQNMVNITLGTGSKIRVAVSGSLVWNPADRLTFSTRTAPTGALTTTRYNCQMWPEVFDMYGS